MPKRLLELFAGSQSLSKCARERGWESVTLDINQKTNPDICTSILDWDEKSLPRNAFDLIWASCPCESYSSLRVRAKIPRAEAMAHADQFVAKTRGILEHFSGALWIVENPGNSLLWKREVAVGLGTHATLVDYCQFGRTFRKRTRLSSNFPLALPTCPGPGRCAQMVGKKHLVPSDRVRTHELNALPEGLCEEILEQTEHFLGNS